jgi:ribulose-phosphate 3-epimerase
MALIMTVEPGFGGQKLIPHTIEKVRALRSYAKDNGYDLDIEVDGGIGVDNLGLLTSAGANVIVAGSSIFKAEDAAKAIAQMREQERLNPCAK